MDDDFDNIIKELLHDPTMSAVSCELAEEEAWYNQLRAKHTFECDLIRSGLLVDCSCGADQ